MPQRAALAPEGPERPHDALSTESQDVAGSVVVPMQARPTLRAQMPADGQACLDDDVAARTRVRGERRRHRYGSLPSVCCIESEALKHADQPAS